jgi:hypothetical protein
MTLTDSPRDALAKIIKRGLWNNSHVTEWSLKNAANDVLACGYQRVPRDSVVVSKIDAEFWFQYAKQKVDYLGEVDAESDISIAQEAWAEMRDRLQAVLEAY